MLLLINIENITRIMQNYLKSYQKYVIFIDRVLFNKVGVL